MGEYKATGQQITYSIQLALHYHFSIPITAREKPALLNCKYQCTSHTVQYVCYGSRVHIHILAGCSLEGKSVDLLLAMIASRNEVFTHATEVFIMLIIHSNQRGTPYTYWRAQSLPAQGLSFAGASSKYSKQMLSSNWFKMGCIWTQRENACLVP